ncbi:MAG: hypothetical protein ABIU58_05885 [Ramlibacter sp.]
MLALALFGPVLSQSGRYHDFADHRVLWGLPFAMDVLSNLPFALAGLAGAACLFAAPARGLSDVERAIAAVFFAALALAPPAILAAPGSGNVLPWGTFQFGGMGVVLWMATRAPCRVALDIRWGLVMAIYGAAKLFEMNDAAIFHWTGHLVSGHTLKHAVAAFAAWPVISAIGALRNSRQNAAAMARTTAAATHRSGAA